MSAPTSPATDLGKSDRPSIANRYGSFSPDGREYRITDPRTPRPWVNIISNPRFGLAVSQTGSGFTWIDNSQLAVITRWQQDLNRDSSGRALYLRDADDGAAWSLSPAPMWPAYTRFECRHGIGYTTFLTEFAAIRAEWTLLAHARRPVELWRVELHNNGDRPRRLELTAFVEWCCGVSPSPRREFHKLFLETEFDPERRAVFARNHMWDVPSKNYGHWNADFPYISALACSEPLLSAQGDMAAFTGRYRDLNAPEALAQDLWKPRFGRHEDPIAALRAGIELRRGERRTLTFALAVGEARPEVEALLDDCLTVPAVDRALEEVGAAWQGRLALHRVQTPEASLNFVINDWIRYQAISGRIWGRAGYYQQSGAYGFRDQLQDSQVWLTIDPQRCRDQLKLHAAHQFADGSVYHWWHPLSEQGHITRMTDDLLWLGFVAANFIRETGEFSVLNDLAPFVDDEQRYPLVEHVLRAFRRVFKRTSPRGLPYIGAGDWNDGLSACGLQERGESVWLAQFLAGLLAEWSELFRRAERDGFKIAGLDAATCRQLSLEFEQRRAALVAAINEHAWDGGWYLRATLDDGTKLGSRENRVGRIFLNAQTWAVLNDVAPPDRAAQCMAAVRQHLVSPAGALLLAPAFDTPNERVGYITRYAPGLRENGGVYTHAATWAIAAACKMRDHELVSRLLTAINPTLKDPDQYWAEPYVLPGNVDGPDSPYHGRAGWTWYTGAAQWLHRVVTSCLLGVKPTFDGLHIEPCLPNGWTGASLTRPWRGCTYDIKIERLTPEAAKELPPGVYAQVTLDGVPLSEPLLPAPRKPGERHTVQVRCR